MMLTDSLYSTHTQKCSWDCPLKACLKYNRSLSVSTFQYMIWKKKTITSTAIILSRLDKRVKYISTIEIAVF